MTPALISSDKVWDNLRIPIARSWSWPYHDGNLSAIIMKPIILKSIDRWKLFGFACRSKESKANETVDYRRDVNLWRDTCDAMEAEKGKRKPRT